MPLCFVIRSDRQLPPDELCSGFFAGSKKIAASAQMPQSAPAKVQRVLFRPLYLAITPQRIASRRWTNAVVRHNVVGSMSDLMKKSPEK